SRRLRPPPPSAKAVPQSRGTRVDRTACRARLSSGYHKEKFGRRIMNEPVLHHYPVSPFAEKARLMLGFKRLAWKSVQIPLFMPKPDVVALTGGYRRTPILQIGADIYCDTALIARVLERIKSSPSFYPQGDTYAVQAAAQFADTSLFWNTVPVGFTPGTGMMKVFFKDATPEYLAAFGKDRSAYRA